MKSIIITLLLTCLGLGLMAEDTVEKTFEGKLTEVSKEVNGEQQTMYFIVVNKKKIKLPKAKEGIDLASFKDKDVTVVVSGTNKTSTNKKTKKEMTRFIPKEIISIAEKAEDKADDKEE